MASKDAAYKHEDHAGNHGDVLKHVVLVNALKELQKIHPEGLIVTDAHSGFGVYDLMLQQSGEHKGGIAKVLEQFANTEKEHEIPPAIRHYMITTLEAVGAEDYENFELYPGSPLLTQSVLRDKLDEHRLCDLYMNEVEGLNKTAQFRSIDCYDPASLDFLVPKSNKHNVILLDACYKEEEEFIEVKNLTTRILEHNPHATVLVWMPLIEGHPFRWSFAKNMKELAKEKAKTGRYFANLVISKKNLQGSAILVCNPPPQFDDVVDPKALHWLAHWMNQGSDQYTVEQFMKKKKPKTPLG